jgi:hypothetical protein
MSVTIGLQTGAQTRFAYLPEGKTAFQTSSEKIIVGLHPGHHLSGQSMGLLNANVSDTGFSTLTFAGARKPMGQQFMPSVKKVRSFWRRTLPAVP